MQDKTTAKAHRLPDRYELRCKKIPRKYLDREGCVYGICWKNVAGKTLNVTRINYIGDEICTVFATIDIPYFSYIFAIRPKYPCPEGVRKEIETLAKYTELLAVYPGYKRRVW